MCAESVLILEVSDWTDASHWRWRLLDPEGAFLADHTIDLDPRDPLLPAFSDLEAYLHQHAAPDRRIPDETRLLEEAGVWIGAQVLGPIGPRILKYGTPVTVRVQVPEPAGALLYRPLELAHANGKPLALQDVSLVFEVAGEQPPVRQQPIGNRLRLLAVFSLPTDASALALRRERYALKQLIERIRQTHDLAIELRVLQYGVTRQVLRAVLEEGDGWDLIHFSGHGLPGELALELPDGRADVIPSDQVVKLLRPARGRLKLVMLSACLSAAPTIEETLRLLGLKISASGLAAGPPLPVGQGEGMGVRAPALVRALVRNLDCAVLAMRFPVGDDFAVALGAELYERLLGMAQPLPRALQLALPAALSAGPSPGVPPLSVTTPALFGQRAVALKIEAPAAAATDFEPPETGLFGFPPEPERFVGRVGSMARACAAIAPGSGKTGVLFHGMAGGGKTACALELAYRYEHDRFQGMVWWAAPEEGKDIGATLLNLALAMEQQLRNFEMTHVVDRRDELEAWLPKLKKLLETNSLLIVLDNLESLLTDEGKWRDERWGLLVRALLAHHGLSRTLLTSRRRPTELGEEGRVEALAIHALSLQEAVLLGRELPNLGALFSGTHAALGQATAQERAARGRALFSRTLAVVQGHPKLLELADGVATDPQALARRSEQAAQAWEGGEGALSAFFATGQSAASEGAFLAALADWTTGLASALPAASRTLFHFLCCLEEGDRQSGVIEPVWPHLWKQLGLAGAPPGLAEALAPLVRSGLTEEARWQGKQGSGSLYRLHPGVAEAGRAAAGAAFQSAVDGLLGDFWMAGFQAGKEQEGKGAGGLVVHAGRSAAPYLLRGQHWEQAATLLQEVVYRDVSPGTIAGVLPWLRRIAQVTRGMPAEMGVAGILAKVLLEAGRWPEAEVLLREVVESTVQRGEWRTASVAAGDLLNLLVATGHAQEVLGLVEQKKDYTRRADLGPWSQLADEAQRLQLLNALGRYDEVLAAIEQLRRTIRNLPEQSAQEEAVKPWKVREGILDTGHSAALGLKQWETMLSLNREIVASEQARGAPQLDVAGTRFNDYGPLLRLKRYDEARALLAACRAVFEREAAVPQLGRVFCALADLEDKLGHPARAISFQHTALRYSYLAREPEDCAISHDNLSNCLQRVGGERPTALAHRLAAGVVRLQTGSGMLATTLRNLAIDVAQFAPQAAPLPASFDELCTTVEQVNGVRFRELFERLPKVAPDGDAAMGQVIAMAQDMAKEIKPKG